MKAFVILALCGDAAVALAQYAPGGNAGGGGGGVNPGGNYGGGGAAIARVAVGPNGFNPGLQGLNSTGGGLFGVTRRTFMGEANFIAAQYFQSAGVPIVTNAAAATTLGGQAAGAYAGGPATSSANLAARAKPSPAASGVAFVDEPAPAAANELATPTKAPALAANLAMPQPTAASLQSASAQAAPKPAARGLRRR
jgi:hypothetical protein